MVATWDIGYEVATDMFRPGFIPFFGLKILINLSETREKHHNSSIQLRKAYFEFIHTIIEDTNAHIILVTERHIVVINWKMKK